MSSRPRKKFQSSKKRASNRQKREERLHLLEKTEERTDDEEEADAESSPLSTDLEQDNHGYGALLSKNRAANRKNGDQDEEKATKTTKKKKSLRHLFRYATCLDFCLLILGSLCSVITGGGFPFLSVIFGGMTNSFMAAEVSNFSARASTDDVAENFSFDRNGSQILDNSTSALQPISLEEFHVNLIRYSLQYTYLGLAVMVCAYLQFACWSVCCERQVYRLRKEFFKSILRQEIAWFDEHQSGELTTKLSDDLERIKEGIGDKFGLLLQYIFQIFSGFVVAFVYSWKLSLVMLAMTPLMALSAGFISKMIAESTKKEQRIYAAAGAIAEEALSCIRTVVAFNGQKQEISRYEEELKKGRKTGILKSVYTAIGFASAFFLMFASYALAFWYGSVLISNGEIDRGTVFVVLFSIMTGSFGLGSAAPLIGVVSVAVGASSSILDIIYNKPKIDAYSTAGKRLPDPKGALKFRNVKFAYPTRSGVVVLNDVSFDVEPGQNVAIVGPSGCGKSTIINLLLRYYEKHSGQITVDGRDIEDLNVRWLRNLIGVVSQEPILFDLTLEENIRFGKMDAEFEHIVEAAKMANAHSFIAQLPDGYKTIVGERGAQLSGGQKQRIAIARALLRDPKILLLDEATSALDSESESLVQEALDKAQKGRTTIVIAHRLSTIKNADKIIVLDQGSIVESGNHAELMAKKGLYFDLVTVQMLNEPEPSNLNGDQDQIVDFDIEVEVPSSSSPKEPLIRRKSSSAVSYSRLRSVSVDSFETTTARSFDKRTATNLLAKGADTETKRLKEELTEEQLQQSTLLDILKANGPEWPYIFWGLIGAIVRGAVMPAFAFFYSEIFKAYSKSADELQSETTFWSLMFVAVGILMAISSLASSYCFGVSGESLTMRLRLGVFRNLLRQSVSYFDDPAHSTGRICTRLSTDAPNIKAAVDFRLSTVLASFVSMFAGIVIAFVYGWKLAFLLLALVPFIGFSGYLNMKLRHSSQMSDSKLLEKAGKIASEGVENIRTVQALTREKTFYDTFVDHLKGPYKQALIQTQYHSISYAFAQCVIFFLYAACFRFGGYLIEIGDTSPLNVFKVFFAITFCGMTLSWATAYFPDFIKARFSAALIFKMMREKPIIDNMSAVGLKEQLKGNVTLKDIQFCYPSRQNMKILRHLDLKVEKGQTVALVGPSGCGKSTIVNLLERFYDPTGGSVLYDENDLKILNLQNLRHQVSLVSQEPVLFNCSLLENISYGLTNVPYDKVTNAARMANIHAFIVSLPEGYQTKVGERGVMLSGGQKQRVAIARALIRDPKILILDEATSALDTENEKLVQEALDRAREGRTCIVIAHRLSTVQNATKIAVIKHGRIVEEVNGTAGECTSLTVDERKSIAETWVFHGRQKLKRIIIHCGAGNLEESKILVSHAADLNIDALAILPPTYFKPRSLDDLLDYCIELCKLAPSVPFLYYHIPEMTGITGEIVKKILLGALAMGLEASIGVSYSVCGPKINRIIEHFRNGDFNSARDHQHDIQEIFFACGQTSDDASTFNVNELIASFKYALKILEPKLDCGPVRLPLKNPSKEKIDRLKKILNP